ncbi:MAG: preprotein translocase subunit SecG [Phycisphaeraceae bacterium]|nr:MAG: preprotein translocase subunit SecG [Phycisphaeraceae bacterium]
MLILSYGIAVNIGLLFFALVCLMLVLTVLIQKPQGGGLSAAFGASSGSGQTAFGTKTGDVLTLFTIIMFAVWLIVAILMNFAAVPDRGEATPVILTGPQAPASNGASPTPPTQDPTPATTPAPAPTPEPLPTPVVPEPATPTPDQPGQGGGGSTPEGGGR